MPSQMWCSVLLMIGLINAEKIVLDFGDSLDGFKGVLKSIKTYMTVGVVLICVFSAIFVGLSVFCILYGYLKDQKKKKEFSDQFEQLMGPFRILNQALVNLQISAQPAEYYQVQPLQPFLNSPSVNESFDSNQTSVVNENAGNRNGMPEPDPLMNFGGITSEPNPPEDFGGIVSEHNPPKNSGEIAFEPYPSMNTGGMASEPNPPENFGGIASEHNPPENLRGVSSEPDPSIGGIAPEPNPPESLGGIASKPNPSMNIGGMASEPNLLEDFGGITAQYSSIDAFEPINPEYGSSSQLPLSNEVESGSGTKKKWGRNKAKTSLEQEDED